MIDLNKLNDLFFDDEIEWRVGQTGMSNNEPWVTLLTYLDARAVMNRLDDACGQTNWSDSYQRNADGGVLCTLSIRTEDGWVSKTDIGVNTDIEPVKGGVSDALKRAFVKWSHGARQLYRLTRTYGIICGKGNDTVRFKGKDGKTYYCRPPAIEIDGIVHKRTLDDIIPKSASPSPAHKQTSSTPTVINEAAPPPGEPTEKSDGISNKQIGLIWGQFERVYQITDKSTVHKIATEFCGLPIETLTGLHWKLGKPLIDALCCKDDSPDPVVANKALLDSIVSTVLDDQTNDTFNDVVGKAARDLRDDLPF